MGLLYKEPIVRAALKRRPARPNYSSPCPGAHSHVTYRIAGAVFQHHGGGGVLSRAAARGDGAHGAAFPDEDRAGIHPENGRGHGDAGAAPRIGGSRRHRARRDRAELSERPRLRSRAHPENPGCDRPPGDDDLDSARPGHPAHRRAADRAGVRVRRQGERDRESISRSERLRSGRHEGTFHRGQSRGRQARSRERVRARPAGGPRGRRRRRALLYQLAHDGRDRAPRARARQAGDLHLAGEHLGCAACRRSH